MPPSEWYFRIGAKSCPHQISPFQISHDHPMHWKGGVPPPLQGAQPTPSHCPPDAASMAFATDSNRPQPLWQPPPTACLTASGATSEVPSRLMHPCRSPVLWGGGGGALTQPERSPCAAQVTQVTLPETRLLPLAGASASVRIADTVNLAAVERMGSCSIGRCLGRCTRVGTPLHARSLRLPSLTPTPHCC